MVSVLVLSHHVSQLDSIQRVFYCKTSGTFYRYPSNKEKALIKEVLEKKERSLNLVPCLFNKNIWFNIGVTSRSNDLETPINNP
jgi:hypothetical protein